MGTLIAALQDNIDQFDAIAARHTITIEDLVTREQVRTRALNKEESHVTRTLLMKNHCDAVSRDYELHVKSREATVHESNRCINATETTRTQISQLIENQMDEQTISFASQLSVKQNGLQQALIQTTSGATQAITDAVEIQGYLTDSQIALASSQAIGLLSQQTQHTQLQLQDLRLQFCDRAIRRHDVSSHSIPSNLPAGLIPKQASEKFLGADRNPTLESLLEGVDTNFAKLMNIQPSEISKEGELTTLSILADERRFGSALLLAVRATSRPKIQTD